MGSGWQRFSRLPAFALFSCLLALANCGGHGSSMLMTGPLSVMLVNPKVVVRQGAAAVVAIRVIAPTESVQLGLDFMPAGVTGTYSAPENNPSGSIQFQAKPTSAPGTYMPRVTVTSEGHSASMIFSLEVEPH